MNFFFGVITVDRNINIILIIQGFNPNWLNNKLEPASVINIYFDIKIYVTFDILL